MAIDGDENCYVTGESVTDTVGGKKNYDFLTVKYDANGNESWANKLDGAAHDDDAPKAITVDALSNVFITGRVNNGSLLLANDDIITIMYDGAGNQILEMTYNSTGNAADGALAMAVLGNIIYVAGPSEGSGTQKDIAVIKYLDSQLPVGVEKSSSIGNSAIAYPNPFSDFTVISVPESYKGFGLRLYDVLGNEVRSIKNITKYTVVRKSNLAEGTYVYTIFDHHQKIVDTGKIIAN